MTDKTGADFYPPLEEKINVISHAVGFIFSIIGLILLVIRASMYGNAWHIVSFTIFGVSLATLYAASTFYHNSEKVIIRKRFKVFDHAAIYALIAGTYTPFSLITMHGTTGWAIFGVSWGLALTGIILKLFFAGRFKILSTIMYVMMGWIIVFAFKPLVNNLPSEGLYWLLGGGIAYTIGAVLYSIKRIKMNHAIFHILVLVGSFCHFISVFFYVLPIE